MTRHQRKPATPRCAGDVENNEVPPAQRKKKIDEAAAMLLYEAPSRIAIFSFDGAYLKNPVKDFWSDLPQLGITCLYVGVPNCEVISCSLKNPGHTLLPEEKSETYKRNCLPSGKELTKFSHQYDRHVKPEIVNESIVELTGLLHGIELREIEHLKFMRILLKVFFILSGIGTKNWSLIELATLLKMICYREASYEGNYPVQIFSDDEYRRIEVNAPRYKTSFSRIDVLSVYEDVISLDIARDILSLKLDLLIEKAVILPTGSKVGKEGSINVDDRLNSIAEDNCSEVSLLNGKLDFSSERPQQDVKQILTILEETPYMEKPNDFFKEETCKEEYDHCLNLEKVQEELTEENVEENKQALDISVQNMDANGKKLTTNKQDEDFHATRTRLNSRPGKQNEAIPTTRARLKSGPPKGLLPEETESEEKEVSTKSRWQMSKGHVSAVRSRSLSAGLSFPAKKSHEETDGRSKVMKQTCMPFICYYSVRCWFGFACQDVSQEY